MAGAKIFNKKDGSVIIQAERKGKRKSLIVSGEEASEILSDLQVMYHMVCLDKDPSDYKN